MENFLQAAREVGSKALNTSRLNVVGEGRGGKTAFVRAISGKAFEDTYNATHSVIRETEPDAYRSVMEKAKRRRETSA